MKSVLSGLMSMRGQKKKLCKNLLLIDCYNLFATVTFLSLAFNFMSMPFKHDVN